MHIVIGVLRWGLTLPSRQLRGLMEDDEEAEGQAPQGEGEGEGEDDGRGDGDAAGGAPGEGEGGGEGEEPGATATNDVSRCPCGVMDREVFVVVVILRLSGTRRGLWPWQCKRACTWRKVMRTWMGWTTTTTTMTRAPPGVVAGRPRGAGRI
jgi:hypothetical protein